MTEKEESEKIRQEKCFESILAGSGTVAESDYPQIIHLRSGFLFLKSLIGVFDKEVTLDIWKCAKKVSSDYNVECSAVMFNIMLSVFEEMKLITLSRSSADFANISLLKTEGKVNIESSEFLARLKKSNS